MQSKFQLFVAILFLTTISSHANETNENAQSAITSATWYSINSSVLKEERRYAVYLPPSYSAQENRHYPVLYVLDGTLAKIRGMAGMVESLSDSDLSRQIPESIVVMIPNVNRSRDLTPTKANLSFKGQVLDNLIDRSGGADKFAQFFQDELFFEIDSRFRTNQIKGIVGMSFGGLFAANILLTKPDMFSHYLIADATYVWDENYINRTFIQSRDKLENAKAKVFIGIANNDHLGEIGMANKQWGNHFIQSLETIENKELVVHSRYFPNEQHGTVMFLAFYYGLIDLFDAETNSNNG